MASIKNAVQEVVDELRNVRDIRKIFDAPQDSANQFPMAWAYPASGEFQKESYGWMVNLHNINIEFVVKRTDLARGFNMLVDVFDEIPKQLEIGLEQNRFSDIQTWENITYIVRSEDWEEGLKVLLVVFTINGVKLLGTTST